MGYSNQDAFDFAKQKMTERGWRQNLRNNTNVTIEIDGELATNLVYQPKFKAVHVYHAPVSTFAQSGVPWGFVKTIDRLDSLRYGGKVSDIEFKKLFWKIIHLHPIQRGHAALIRILPGIFHGLTEQVIRLHPHIDLLGFAHQTAGDFANDPLTVSAARI